MNIELIQAAQQAVDAFDAFGDADDFESLFGLTQKMRALRTAIHQTEAQQPAMPEPLADHSDHVAEIAARLRLVAKLAGCPDAVPDEDGRAVGCIFSVLGNMRRALEKKLATGEPVAWRNVIPGGRKTDEWESTRIADYNLGWNAYRKAVKTALEHLETSTQPLPSAWMYTLEYGGTIADTKVSLRQLNYPFGVCGADYLRGNSDGISYVRQTPLYTHPAPSVPDDVVRDAISTVREHYRGTDWGKAAESICDAIDAARKDTK